MGQRGQLMDRPRRRDTYVDSQGCLAFRAPSFCMHSRRSVNKILVLLQRSRARIDLSVKYVETTIVVCVSSIAIFLSTEVKWNGRKALPHYRYKLLGVGQGEELED